MSEPQPGDSTPPSEPQKEEPLGSRTPEYLPPPAKEFFKGVFMGKIPTPSNDDIELMVDHLINGDLMTPLSDREFDGLKEKGEYLVRYQLGEARSPWHYFTAPTVFLSENNSDLRKTIAVQFGLQLIHSVFRPKINAFLTGPIAEQVHKQYDISFLPPGQKEELLINPLITTHGQVVGSRITPKGTIGKSELTILGNGTRHLAQDFNGGGFESYGFTQETFKTCTRKIRKTQGKKETGLLSGLDVGGSNGLAAWEAEQIDPNIAFTNMTADTELGVWPLKGGHLFRFAEAMPAEWRERFDLILSNMTSQYFRLPHIALKNMTEALKVGGIMHIAYNPNFVILPQEDMIDAQKIFAWFRKLEDKGVIEYLPYGKPDFDEYGIPRGGIILQKKQSIPLETT